MIVTGKHLHRRTFLRGVGVALALPMLDAMRPALANAETLASTTAPTRLAFTYIPNGVNVKYWKPTDAGADWKMTRILQPLEKFRGDFSVLTGLDHANADSLGDGGGDHARAGACFLTGVHPKKTAGADIQSGISVDQIAAQQFSKVTRLSSLELGCEDSRTVGSCDSGYSCAYTNSVSWRGPQTPMPPETNPRIAFERLFGDEDFSATPAQRAQRRQQRSSILDLVNQRTAKLQRDLGPSDRHKMDEYLTGVRELEQRIQMSEKDKRTFRPDIEKPAGVPAAFTGYVKLMYDLQILAFQADLTRVSTLIFGREASVRTYPEVGVSDPHHPLSHHRNLPENLEKLAKINTFHTTLFAYYLEKMKSIKDGDGSLLDHSMLVYGGAISDGNSHSHHDLPVLLAGRGRGTLNPGRHVVYKKGTPMTNLYVSLLGGMGISADKLGDSTGKLKEI